MEQSPQGVHTTAGATTAAEAAAAAKYVKSVTVVLLM